VPIAQCALAEPGVNESLKNLRKRPLRNGDYSVVSADRGQFFDHPTAGSVTTTVHPSAILRAVDSDQRHADFEAFVKDLQAVRRKLDSLG